MPMYEGFFDHKDEKTSDKFMLKVRARNEVEAKEAFQGECPESHQLVSMAQKNGHSRQFLMGLALNTIEHSQYARSQRLLPPTDETLEAEESERERADGAVSAQLDAKSTLKGPTLDDLKRRNPTPTTASLINACGFILVVISGLIALYLLTQSAVAIKAFAMSFIPGIVAGLLLIAVAWSMKALNRIAIASEFQAQLLEYQHQNPPESAQKDASL